MNRSVRLSRTLLLAEEGGERNRVNEDRKARIKKRTRRRMGPADPHSRKSPGRRRGPEALENDRVMVVGKNARKIENEEIVKKSAWCGLSGGGRCKCN